MSSCVDETSTTNFVLTSSSDDIVATEYLTTSAQQTPGSGFLLASVSAQTLGTSSLAKLISSSQSTDPQDCRFFVQVSFSTLIEVEFFLSDCALFRNKEASMSPSSSHRASSNSPELVVASSSTSPVITNQQPTRNPSPSSERAVSLSDGGSERTSQPPQAKRTKTSGGSRQRQNSSKSHIEPTASSSNTATLPGVVYDVACCDGPVRFHRVLNENYAPNAAAAATPQVFMQIFTLQNIFVVLMYETLWTMIVVCSSQPESSAAMTSRSTTRTISRRRPPTTTRTTGPTPAATVATHSSHSTATASTRVVTFCQPSVHQLRRLRLHLRRRRRRTVRSARWGSWIWTCSTTLARYAAASFQATISCINTGSCATPTLTIRAAARKHPNSSSNSSSLVPVRTATLSLPEISGRGCERTSSQEILRKVWSDRWLNITYLMWSTVLFLEQSIIIVVCKVSHVKWLWNKSTPVFLVSR